MTQNSLVLFVCFVFLLEIHGFLEVLDLISHTNILNSGCSMTISSQFIFFLDLFLYINMGMAEVTLPNLHSQVTRIVEQNLFNIYVEF